MRERYPGRQYSAVVPTQRCLALLSGYSPDAPRSRRTPLTSAAKDGGGHCWCVGLGAGALSRVAEGDRHHTRRRGRTVPGALPRTHPATTTTTTLPRRACTCACGCGCRASVARPQRNWCHSQRWLIGPRPRLPRSRCCLCAIRGRSPRVPSPPLAQPGPNPPTPARALFESCQRPLIGQRRALPEQPRRAAPRSALVRLAWHRCEPKRVDRSGGYPTLSLLSAGSVESVAPDTFLSLIRSLEDRIDQQLK